MEVNAKTCKEVLVFICSVDGFASKSPEGDIAIRHDVYVIAIGIPADNNPRSAACSSDGSIERY